MDSLKLLLKVQKDREAIVNYNNIIKDSSYIRTLKKIKVEFDKSKIQFKQKAYDIEKIKLNYKKISGELASLKKELEELKSKLYNYTGCDLKFINALQREIAAKEGNVKSLDDKLLELLENEEKLSLSFEEFRSKLSELKNNFYNYKNKANEKINDAKSAIIENTESINKIEASLPEELLKEFNKIFSLTGSGVGELNKNTCSACKMKVSSLTIDSIKKGEKIVYCDNCGRIIYYNDTK